MRCLGAVAIGLLVGSSSAGCSFLFDPDELKDFEVVIPPDPLDPAALSLELAAPTEGLLEGTGDSGGRPALLVINGKNIDLTATVTITRAGTTEAVPGIELVGAPAITGGTWNRLAIPVIARVNDQLDRGMTIPLDVTVTQPINDLGETISKTVPWTLVGYDELISLISVPLNMGTDTIREYSVVNITGGLTAASTAKALIIHSNSSIKITGAVQVNAGLATAPGAGGAAGGPSTANGGGPGGGGGFPGTLLINGQGGGGGFATAPPGTLPGKMAGDPLITSYETNRGSGGGGGAAAIGAGGAGGGGGGTIELTARSTVTLQGAVSARGGSGAGNATIAGGGGSGGVIVLRGGLKVDAPMVFDVSGGGGNGNAGASGRIRIDTPELVASPATQQAARRGGTFPMKIGAVPTSTEFPFIADNTQKELTYRLLGSPGSKIDIFLLDESGQNTAIDGQKQTTVDFQNTNEVTTRITLLPGFNRICAVPTGSNTSLAESTNCIDVAYIPNTVPDTASSKKR